MLGWVVGGGLWGVGLWGCVVVVVDEMVGCVGGGGLFWSGYLLGLVLGRFSGVLFWGFCCGVGGWGGGWDVFGLVGLVVVGVVVVGGGVFFVGDLGCGGV
uniref:NADH dehydrogenase subunit 6 n=1 Tax=Knipowitschia caucasica TaxID=637954 RepID=A0AAV2M081_KNICA